MPAYFDRPLSVITTRWRIFHEESVFLNPQDEKSDFEEIRGKGDTRIYRHGQAELAVSSDNPRTQTRLRDLLGIPRKPRPVNEWWGNEAPSHLPRAKTGSVLLFPDELLDTVAEAIGAQKKRHYTPEQLEELRERGARGRERILARAHGD